jgi:DNA sulfur modification protein DndD
MRVKKVEIHDFQRFRGEHHLDFEREGAKALNIVHADNGRGKSTLFYAIGWAFNADFQIFDAQGNPKEMRIAPRSYLVEGNDVPEVESKVIVIFEHNGFVYRLSRSALTKRDGAGWLPKPHVTTFLCNREDIDAPEMGDRVSEADLYAQYLDKRSVEYFLFDGDHSADNFINKPKELQKVLWDLLNLKNSQKVVSWLSKQSEGLRTKAAASTGDHDISIAEEDCVSVEKTLGAARSRLENLEKAKATAVQGHARLVARFESVREVSRYKEADRDHERLQKELKTRRSDFRSSIKKMDQCCWMTINGHELLDKVSAEYVARNQSGQLPRDYKDEFIDGILKKEVCICGVKFAGNEEVSNRLKALLDFEVDELSEKLTGLSGKIRNAQLSAQKELERATQALTEYSNCRSNTRKAKQKLDVARSSLPVDVDQLEEIDDSPGIGSRIKDYDDQIHNLRTEIAAAEHEIETREEQHRRAEKNLKEMVQASSLGKEHFAKAECCAQVLDLLQEANKTMEAWAIKSIADGANQVKDRLFSDVGNRFEIVIAPDFRVSIVDHNIGEYVDMDPDFSAGESMLAGYAILFAVAKSVGGEQGMPFIVDNFFAKLSDSRRKAIIRELPEIFEQTIFFSHDGDLPKQLQEYTVSEHPNNVQEWTIAHQLDLGGEGEEHLLYEACLKPGYLREFLEEKASE